MTCKLYNALCKYLFISNGSYRVYISILDAVIREELPCERETGNERDSAVAIVKAWEAISR